MNNKKANRDGLPTNERIIRRSHKDLLDDLISDLSCEYRSSKSFKAKKGVLKLLIPLIRLRIGNI